MRIAVGGIASVVCLAIYAADPTPKERFDQAVIEAKANLETPAGKAYDVAIAKHFEEHFGPVLSQCFESTPKPDASSFDMVFVLSSEGKSRDILVWPETNVATCFAAHLRATALPVPPKDGYLAYMEMRLAP
jgi:hypothetical protein